MDFLLQLSAFMVGCGIAGFIVALFNKLTHREINIAKLKFDTFMLIIGGIIVCCVLYFDK